MLPKEGPVEPLHRFDGVVTAMLRCGRTDDFDAAIDRFIRFDRAQQTAQRIGVIPIERILELGVPQDRKEFRHQVEFDRPRFKTDAIGFVFDDGEIALGIVGGHGADDQFADGDGTAQIQTELPVERTVREC